MDAHTSSQKLDTVFEKLKCAAKLSVAFGYVLKNVEDGTYRYYYEHEKNILMERSKLVAQRRFGKNQECFQLHSCDPSVYNRTRNTKWKFYKLPNVTVSPALLRKVPMGCKDTVLLEPLTKNHNVNCLAYEENTRKPYNDNLCLFRALALRSHGKGGLDEET